MGWIRDMLERNIQRQRSLLELPEGIQIAINIVRQHIETRLTRGRASAGNYRELGGHINVIPSKHEGDCSDVLITFCYNKDSFEGRIMESLDHAAKFCPRTCRNIYFISTQWKSDVADKLSGYVDSVRKNNVNICFIHMTEEGIVVMPM